MRLITTFTVIGFVACAATPALADKPAPKPAKAAAAQGPTKATKPAKKVTSAQAQCRAERTAMGTALFAETYGSGKNHRNAFGKCVSRKAKEVAKARKAARKAAATTCKAEQTADPVAFTAKYGTGTKKANAYGKCVSASAKPAQDAAVAESTEADVNAAKSCKAAQTADRAAFAATYGKRSSAFGKCVSRTARAQA